MSTLHTDRSDSRSADLLLKARSESLSLTVDGLCDRKERGVVREKREEREWRVSDRLMFSEEGL